MKKYILPIILFIMAIISLYYVYNKVNIYNYKFNKFDNNFMKEIKGTEFILINSLETEKQNWGKNDNISNSKLYLKYVKYNLDEMANYLKKHSEDKFNLKASLLLDDLYNLYYLNELIGNDQIKFENKYKNIMKNIKIHKSELEKVIK